jgi:hypothetical protein
VARESHARPEESRLPMGDAGAAEERRKPWWGEVVGGDVVHTRQEDPWRVQTTLWRMGSGREHDDCRWTQRMPANPLVRHVKSENWSERINLDPKISTQKTHKTRWKETR